LRPFVLVAALVATASTATPPRAPGEPSLKDVVHRMGAYVDAYGEKASIVVATERYTQEAHSNATPATRRVLVSDFAIVKVEGIRGWMGFRDVREVDGHAVEDREDRLIKALMSSSASYDEARRIAEESARYNVGAVLRTFNVPTTTLFFFTSGSLDRFKFSRKRSDADAWEIGFRETAKPTLIRTPDGQSVPTEGSVWVNPSDGTVLRTRTRMTDFAPRTSGGSRGTADVDVSYQRVPAIDMWLPATMTESYDASRGLSWDRATGRSEYTDYRQFQTMVRIK
jgi:hypothetical protein